FSMSPPPLTSPLFPYTTLFRSKHRFEENLELDFSFGLKGLARFRGNLFNQRGATGAVFRVIPFEIKSFQQLGLPGIVSRLCEKRSEEHTSELQSLRHLVCRLLL